MFFSVADEIAGANRIFVKWNRWNDGRSAGQSPELARQEHSGTQAPKTNADPIIPHREHRKPAGIGRTGDKLPRPDDTIVVATVEK